MTGDVGRNVVQARDIDAVTTINADLVGKVTNVSGPVTVDGDLHL